MKMQLINFMYSMKQIIILIFYLLIIFFVVNGSGNIRVPFVQRQHSGVITWGVFQKHIQSLFPEKLDNAYIGHSKEFGYYDSFLARKMPNFQTIHRLGTSNYNSICYGTNTSTQEYHYFSGNIMNFHDIYSNINANLLFANISSLSALSAHIWISGPFAKTFKHYDGVNNIFVQLEGSKTFFLYPPREFDRFHIYGRNHPFACQSRLDQNNLQHFSILSQTYLPQTSQFDSNLKDDYGIRITLQPGDIMYLPPYWIHEVETSEVCSTSISFWWESEESQSLEMLYSNPLPIESSWSSQEKIDVVLYFLESFLKSIIESLERQMSLPLIITTTFKEILLSRYEEEDDDLSSRDYHLQEKLSDLELNHKVVTYANQQAKLLREQLHEIVFEGPQPQDYINNERILIYQNLFANEDSFHDYVSLVAIKSADYIEEVLRFVVGMDSTIDRSELSQIQHTVSLYLRLLKYFPQ